MRHSKFIRLHLLLILCLITLLSGCGQKVPASSENICNTEEGNTNEGSSREETEQERKERRNATVRKYRQRKKEKEAAEAVAV